MLGKLWNSSLAYWQQSRSAERTCASAPEPTREIVSCSHGGSSSFSKDLPRGVWSPKGMPRDLLAEIYHDWSFRGNGNFMKQRLVGTDFWDSAGKTILYTRLRHGPNASSYGPSKSTSPTSHQHDVRKGVSVMSQWYGRHGAVRYLRMKVGHN